jgi:hypothetical protein
MYNLIVYLFILNICKIYVKNKDNYKHILNKNLFYNKMISYNIIIIRIFIR